MCRARLYQQTEGLKKKKKSVRRQQLFLCACAFGSVCRVTLALEVELADHHVALPLITIWSKSE